MDTKFTATELSMAPNLRRNRATMFTAAVMKVLDGLLEPDEAYPRKRRDASDRLFNLFYDEGFDVVTDEDRHNVGLPKRGELGWTDRELHILENTRIMKLLQPVQPFLAGSAALSEPGKPDGDGEK